MAEIGKKAPDFTLKDESGEEVKLSDLKGKWVVLVAPRRPCSSPSMQPTSRR
jgi:peroxiredoxin